MASTLALVTYPTTCAILAFFGLFALVITFYHRRKQGKDDSTEFFLTARHTAGTLRIAWYEELKLGPGVNTSGTFLAVFPQQKLKFLLLVLDSRTI
jgi:hypothetical protein